MKIATKADFDSLIDHLKEIILRYENNVLHYNQYQIYFANGEKINFEILPQTVPHLLGIKLDYIRSTVFFKEQDAYKLLKEFLEQSYFVYQQVQKGYLSYNAIFSSHIIEKIEAFEKNIYFFNPNDIEFICKYDKSRTFQLGLEKNYPCDYFIAKKGYKGELYILGLVNQGNKYMPMSNLFFLNDENQMIKIRELLTNQILTFPNSIVIENIVTGFKNNRFLSVNSKLEKIKTLKNYTRFIKGTAIDVSSDYQFIMNGFQMKEDKINMYKIICRQFMQSILEHEIFLLEQFDENSKNPIDHEMIELIEAYNNKTCQNPDTNAEMTFSDLLKRYKMLENQVLALEQQLDFTKQENFVHLRRIKELEQENIEYKRFQEDIITIATRVRVK